MITLRQFIDQYNGKNNVGDTPENTNECVGLVEKWIDNLALPHVWGNAIDLLTNADRTAYTVIYNSPTNSPSAGDIVVLGKPYGSYTTTENGVLVTKYYGHTGIVVKADINSLTIFEQNDHTPNDPTGVCQENEYTYSSVVGWLHPNNLPGTETIPVAPTVEQVQSQLQVEIVAVNQCQNQLKIANEQLTETLAQKAQLQTDYDTLKLAYESSEKEIVSLTHEIASFTADRRDYAIQTQQSKEAAAQLTEYLDTIAVHAGVDIKGQTDDKITSSVLLVLSQQAKTISVLQKQNNLIRLVKTGVAQTTSTSPKISLLQRIQNFFFTQD